MTKSIDLEPVSRSDAASTTKRPAASFDAIDPLINERTVKKLTTVSDRHIRRLIKKNDFPKPIRLSEHRIAWKLSEVMGWIAARERASRSDPNGHRCTKPAEQEALAAA
jgi:prophage regulatory protein